MYCNNWKNIIVFLTLLKHDAIAMQKTIYFLYKLKNSKYNNTFVENSLVS